MKLTMSDIAKATGVSQPTVSRILNGNVNVSSEKTKKVLEYIEKVGYRPNMIAKSLTNNSSYLIGFCVPYLSNPYFYDVVETIEKNGRKNNYSIILHNSQNNPLIEKESISDFIERRVDGIIFIPSSDLNLDFLEKTKIPTVILTQSNKKFDSVAVNHRAGGTIVAKHLLNLGHQKIGYIGGEIDDDDKFIGFRNELINNGIDFDFNHYLSISDFSNPNYIIADEISTFLEKIKDNLPSAFFANNDTLAYEVIKALDKLKIKVPEDISVVGFDDTLVSKILKITSVRQPIEDISNLAFELLMEKIKNPSSINKKTRHIELEPYLFKRDSSDKVIRNY